MLFEPKRRTIITLDIFYYLPDHQSLIQEFLWQTEDYAPDYQRMHKFLNYWRLNVNAVIKEILFKESETAKWRNVDYLIKT